MADSDQDRHNDLPADLREQLLGVERQAHTFRKEAIAKQQEKEEAEAAAKKPDEDMGVGAGDKGRTADPTGGGNGAAARSQAGPLPEEVPVPEDDEELDAAGTKAGLDFVKMGAADAATKRIALEAYNAATKRQRRV